MLLCTILKIESNHPMASTNSLFVDGWRHCCYFVQIFCPVPKQPIRGQFGKAIFGGLQFYFQIEVQGLVSYLK